ncbi:MAG: TonB-dependent receptor family protein [Bacteroidota bacterium]|jgi:Fe(3+) dicitrate transport protein
MRLPIGLFVILATAFASTELLAQQTASNDSSNQISVVQIVGKKLMVLPGSGAYISSESISRSNQSDINKVLRLVPGVNIRDEDGYGLRPNIGLRGTPVNRSAKITLMEDGILMAPAPYSDPSAYYFPTFSRMEAIEVLKGSSQIQYGPYTIGGAINLVSTPIPNVFEGFAHLSYGSFNTNQQRIWVGDSQNKLDYVFEINRLASDGFKDLDFGGNTGFDRRDFMGKLRWSSDPSDKINQSVSIKFVNTTELGFESYLGLTYKDYVSNPMRRYAATQKDRIELQHNHVALTHDIQLRSNLVITTTTYLSQTIRNWSKVQSVEGKGVFDIVGNPNSYDSLFSIMTGFSNGSIGFQDAERSYFSKGVQSNLKWDFKTGSSEHRLVLGMRLHEDESDRYATLSDFDMVNGTMVLQNPGVKGNSENQIRHAMAASVFLHHEWRLKRLSVYPGLRIEGIELDYSDYGKNDNARVGTNLVQAENKLMVYLPGLGLSYRIGTYASAFGGVHKGFSPPGMPLPGDTKQANPETAISYELGSRYRSENTKAQLVLFFNHYNNILGSDNVSSGGAGTGNMFNAGEADIKGVEFCFEYDIMKLLRTNPDFMIPVGFNYTYTDARFMETFIGAGGDWGTGIIIRNDFIPFITPHLFCTTIGFEKSRFNSSLTIRYVGETRVKPSQGASVLPNEQVGLKEINALSGYSVVDISVNYTFKNRITLYSRVNNLFNDKHIVSNLPQGYRPGMPLSIMGGVKYGF